MEPALELEHLCVSFATPQGTVEAVRDVSFSLAHGETLAIVGESGCGKSVLCRAVLKLLPDNARISGVVRLEGENIAACGEKVMRKLRGARCAMLFQDPMLSLNPVVPVGGQIMEAILQHKKVSRSTAREEALHLLNMVGIDRPQQRMALQPHFFSGGMRQRLVLAVALAAGPRVLLADEPTTSLDVSVQAQMLDLMQRIQQQTGIGIVLISHDLGVVARVADKVAVMYAGKIVETGTAQDVFYHARHPYTWGLLQAMPALAQRGSPLHCIPGMPPSLLNPLPGDAFAPRNAFALAIDYEQMPPMFKISATHSAATWLLDERAPAVKRPLLPVTEEGLQNE